MIQVTLYHSVPGVVLSVLHTFPFNLLNMSFILLRQRLNDLFKISQVLSSKLQFELSLAPEFKLSHHATL